MIGYAFVGTNNLDASLAFWDKVAAALGGKRLMQVPKARGWFYGNGKGAMVALACDDTDAVDSAYKVALDAGAEDDGEPGWRLENVFYGAYFRDPCGNKVCVYKMNMG